MPVKFSEFINGGTLANGNVVVGLEGGANTRFTFSGSGGDGFAWNVINTDTTMEANNGYLVDDAALITLTMSSSLAAGDVYEVANVGSGGWVIQLNAGQTVRLGVDLTIAGGSVASTQDGDSIRLVAINGTDLIVLSSQGNISLA